MKTRAELIAEFYRRTELHGDWTLADWLCVHGFLTTCALREDPDYENLRLTGSRPVK